MIIDLRSDTVTKPSKEMLQSMFEAEVGDDVFSEDPTVLKLENKAAEKFGMEASVLKDLLTSYWLSGLAAGWVALIAAADALPRPQHSTNSSA